MIQNIFSSTQPSFSGDPKSHRNETYHLVYALADELVNRLVGYANTLLSVHSGENSYNAEYKK
ncbi:hypothetical protein J2S19_000583 [Metabacillus malikii]|uniref:Uncharacterized protein n=1 Tax=Metabacillus malikii TaxID=1504265 RepID=A0ABT9ZAR0_9BACI|nr:hypothetical protein [Metabacillus malikii]